MSFTAPVAEQILALRANARIDALVDDPDMVSAIVEGIGAFAASEWAPLNRIGDCEGARLGDGKVMLPKGFAAAYRAYVDAGWNGIAAPEEFGGQGLPFSLGIAAMESLGSANLAFSLLPMLTMGAIAALRHHGTADQQARYLPRLVSGEWSGTMNLTEPQAGSDVGALGTRATPICEGPDAGLYRIAGTKIFITWGEHELTDNIVHLVLARIAGAPPGSRGISLFVVPRFRIEADGSTGARNDVKAVGLEHKLGIHASPTCVMSYGDKGECIGELVGGENEGLAAMFTMMNHARINVGAQGVEIAERALQQAHAYARERVQSARAGSRHRTPVAIVEHPDVRRMLLRMRALTEGARALLYYACGQVDRGALGDAAAWMRADLLVPLVKAWCTEVGVEVASLNIQVHGGMGYIEETGAAQLYRDARIPPIYEGTNGIQAADLVTRKLALESGGVLTGLMDEIAADTGAWPALRELATACTDTGQWMIEAAGIDDRLAGSMPFLTMCAVATAGWQLLAQARAAAEDPEVPAAIAARKPVVARYFLEHLVPEALGLHAAAHAGSSLLYQLDADGLTE
ncbi:MAG TPA: acyl-CoA dehydrogenase family protein [Novosphingobium sp.]|nr:acyl-CoA dehydrogenase family protein [Novosphingobium sp.]